MNLSELLSEFDRGPRVVGPTRYVEIDGFDRPLPVRVMDAPNGGCHNAPLVFVFHGRVNREKLELPTFDGRFILREEGRKRSAVVVSIHDSSLAMSPTLQSAFFAGDAQCDLQSQIGHFISGLIHHLTPSKVVFVGGSTGGHPALLHSVKIPQSIAVVCNPIMTISAYSQFTIREYLNACWPGRSLQDLSSLVTDDVGEHYGGERENTVIYLQNATDHHVPLQMIPFVGKLRDHRNFLLNCEFIPGSIGHAYPASRWAKWVRAAIEAPGVDAMELAAYYARIADQSSDVGGAGVDGVLAERVWLHETGGV